MTDAAVSAAAGPRLGRDAFLSLDGTWDFVPGDHEHDALDELEPEAIRVPGLWEAQGHLDLDGVAWYRRRLEVDATDGYWTLRFGAVMDFADVFLNGVHVGSHEHAFTPFELDVSGALLRGENVLAVSRDGRTTRSRAGRACT